VAIKTILRSAILDEEESRDYAQRFVREAQAVAKLTHPHIVGVYDFGDEDDITFIVMEYIESDLKKMLINTNIIDFDQSHILTILYNSLCALNFIHSANIMH
jgi:serine/threonine-protein kinase